MVQVFRRVAAVAEVLALLIGVALLLRLILPSLPPALIGGAWSAPDESALPLAITEATTIGLRFVLLIALGFLLLWLRFRVPPAGVGVSTGGRSLGHLVLAGLSVAAIGALPWKAIVLWNMHVQAGDGLHAWDQINAAGPRADVILLVLASAMVLPPVLEEIFARGYMRGRLGLVFGPACGVLVAALIFALSHGHFYSGDPVVQALAASSFFAAIVFGWVTYRLGSLLPAMIGHAILNAPEPSDPMAMAFFVGALALLAALSAPALAREIAALFAALASERWAHLLWIMPGLAVVFWLGAHDSIVLIATAAVSAVLVAIDMVTQRRTKSAA